MNPYGKYKTWAEIDVAALRHNYRQIASHVHKEAPDCRVIAAVKANAYGHGADIVAQTLVEEGCGFFAVSCLYEAVLLRETVGRDADIIILGYSLPEDTETLVRQGIIQTIFSPEYASAMSREMARLKASGILPRTAVLRTHIKLDTGMSRIGFAVHTPTYYSVAYRYSASLSSKALSAGNNPYGWEVINGSVYANESTPILQDGGDNRWCFTTPTRLLAGVSYAIGRYAIISVDYQYDAYRALKWNYTPVDTGYTNDVFKDGLKGVHTIRAGVEAKPLPWLSLRVGGGYKSNVLSAEYDFVAFSEPVADKVWYASAGLGFRLGEVTSIDLAYQYRNTRYSDYYSFYTQIGNTPNCSPIYGLDIIRHNIALTFAFRF